jgi:biofilm PGA synthesis lipoprotein PgaB
MSYSRKNRPILLSLALLLAIAFGTGLLIWPEQGDASSQVNESSTLVTSISASDESVPIYYTDQVAILTYHHLSSQETTAAISPTRFREHLQGLQKLGYHFISLNQLSAFLDGQVQVPPNAVAITFDDGYASVYRHAFPTLQAQNIPAAIFMIVKYIGADEDQIPKLSWAQMEEMQVWGMQFESHTYDSHLAVKDRDGRSGPSLTSRGYLPQAKRDENAVEYQDRILSDLFMARSILENRLGTEVKYLALPFGAHNRAVQNTARLAGYDYIFTTDPGLVSQDSDRLALPRFNAGQGGWRAQDLHRLILKYSD